ncbi:MAG: hypothetical protein FWD15_00095 [Alphaproteobacteria bacterium]|nr:hypothetical protein [Alphaproteobacteria bacterium]
MHNIKPFVDEKIKLMNKKFRNEPKEITAFCILSRLQSKLGCVSKEVCKEFGYAKPDVMDEPMCGGRKIAGLIIKAYLLGEFLGFDMNKELATKVKMGKQKLKMKEAMMKPAANKPAARKKTARRK